MMDRVSETAARTGLLVSFFLIAVGSMLGQSNVKDGGTNAAPNQGPQTVNAQQSGTWTVGIDPARNRVELSVAESDPLPVRTVNGRKPFQHRAVISLSGDAFSTLDIPVPAGRRLVIENITAKALTPVGMRAEVQVITHFDNDDNGVFTLDDMMFNRVVLIDQGVFQSLNVALANQKVLAYADSTIGGGALPVRVQGRINGALPAGGFAQAHVTISGYLEEQTTMP